MKISPTNEEEEEESKLANSILQNEEDKKHKKKLRGPIMELKQLRGTIHMPKLEDFTPKRFEIFPLSPPRNQKPIIQSTPVIDREHLHQPFRRHKYVKSDMKI